MAMNWTFPDYSADKILGIAVTVAVFGIAAGFAALRSASERKSHSWYGCLAAPVVFLVVLRKAAGLALPGTVLLVAAGLAGEAFGHFLFRGWSAPSPLRWRVAVYGTLVAALVLLTGGSARSEGFNRLEVNAPAPGFVLKDQNGLDTRLTDFKGKVVVATFFYSTCIDICPILLGTLEAAEVRLTQEERSRVHFVAITIDPNRDTSDRLKAFMAERDLTANHWTLLTGSIVDVAKVADAFEVVARPGAGGDFVHNSVYIVIDGDGIDRVEFHGAATPAQAVADEVMALLREPPRSLTARVRAWIEAFGR